uniref:Uncharacterized protein n=2 Tax=Oryza TaxID=4527 RepID=A0A0D3F944_9ORYZ
MKLVFPDEFARPVKNRYRSQLTSFSGPSKKYCSLSVKNKKKKKKKKCCSTAEITKHSVRILSHRTVRPFCSTRLHSLQKQRNQLDRCHRKWRIYDINTLNSQFRRSCLGHRHALARQQEDAFILEVGGMATWRPSPYLSLEMKYSVHQTLEDSSTPPRKLQSASHSAGSVALPCMQPG